MENMSPEQKRDRLSTIVKWIIAILATALISPIIFLSIKGMVGLAIAFVVGQVVIQLAPVASLKLANWKMKLLIAEVKANPIETMKNLWVEKDAELKAADERIVDFETEVGAFADHVTDFSQQYPEESEQYKLLLEKMRSSLEGMKTEQSNARGELKAFKEKITRAEAIYSMSLAAQNVVKLSGSAEAAVFAEIKEKVAFDSVRNQLNRAFANLNLALERRQDAVRLATPKAIPAQ